MRSLRIAAIVLLTVVASVPAWAVTVDQIVSLSKAGVSEAVILALLERDRTVLTIDADQIVALKRDGLSDALITAMLRSGREEGDEAARQVSAWNTTTFLNDMATTPQLVIVGHGPDRPNTVHTEDWYAGFRDGVAVPSGYRLGSTYPLGSAYTGLAYSGSGYVAARPSYRNGLTSRSLHANNVGAPEKGKGMLCLAQVNTANGPGPSYVTECPAVMQRAARTR